MAARGAAAGVTLHRFFLSESCVHQAQVSFPREVARQIERVLRLRAGERVVVLTGDSLEHTVTLRPSPGGLTGCIEGTRRNRAEPSVALTLYQGLLKGSKAELVLQKGTEIGVSRFVPVRTIRSVPRGRDPARLERDRKIVREAAEQAGRGRLPEIMPVMDLEEALEEATAEGPVIFLWEEERERRLRNLSWRGEQKAALFVGPEGGFSGDEAALARAAGAAIVTLGPRVLRAETAAIVGAALLIDTFPEPSL